MSAVRKAAKRLRIVEDAAHAAGATCGDWMVGERGTAVFSFYATKNMTCGEGGMVATDDDELAGRARLIAGQGIDKDALSRFRAGDWEYDVVQPGVKANMSDVLAALGRVQLGRLHEFGKRRRQIADRYSQALEGTPIQPLEDPGHGQHARHLYVVQVSERDRFRQSMLDAGIDTSVHFIPLHRMTAFAAPKKRFPVAERLYRSMVSLPLYPAMTDDDVEYVIETAVNLTTSRASPSGHLYG
jgi:dTDP-4-amino-4,6-dideoxygalactose transaminase